VSILFWKIVGWLGQLMFSGRFLVQWIASERAGKSITPRSFWYLSIGGNLLLLSYAMFYVRDEIIILGQLFGSVVYVRNLMLLDRERAQKGEAAAQTADERARELCVAVPQPVESAS
jgi:lipid-A-disaccharide synthase-like uncharacterized protein